MHIEQVSPTPIVENFWYPILDSHSLPNSQKILRLKRFDRNLVLWADSNGKITCMDERCAHRGAPLGLGSVEGNCIRCPYHGFTYNRSGECTQIPAQGSKKVPAHFRVKTYPIRIEHGFVWMWWGNEEPSSNIPFFEELRSEDHPVCVSVKYPSAFYRLMESNLDGYHIDHLHANVSPKALGPIVKDVEVEVTDRLIHATTRYQAKEEGKTSTTVVNQVLFPNLALSLGVEAKMWNVIGCVPMDRENSWFMIRFYFKPFRWPLVGPLFAKIFSYYVEHILLPQDFAVQREQWPRDTGIGHDKFIHADKGVAAYLKMLQQELNLKAPAQQSIASAREFTISGEL